MVEIEIGVLGGQCFDRRIALSSASNPKSREIDSEMQHAPVSNGCSPSTRPAQNPPVPIPCQTDIRRPKLEES
jgi:hypothetical protein